MPPLLEVIALSPDDARLAVEGGADRLEIVREIGVGGLTPALDQFEAIRAEVSVPLRVMLRTNGGFTITDRELDALIGEAGVLMRAGADQFVFGFLDDHGLLDLDALGAISAATTPCPWTLHHAFDHAADAESAWATVRTLPCLDHVLSGGIAGDLNLGLQTLCDRSDWQEDGPRWLAGGGLVPEYLPPLKAARIQCFHIGRAARFGHSWNQPVNPDAVRRWKIAIADPG